LALARRDLAEIPVKPTVELIERDLQFLGLVGILDPPRPEARAAVAQCHAAGIRPVMITGDHPVTARVIAERLGIWSQGDAVVNGRDLEELSAGQAPIPGFPRNGLRQSFPRAQASNCPGTSGCRGVGRDDRDGVNDAPALKRAEIGVSMGMTGTDVAKEASAMVLLDDRFSTIVGPCAKAAASTTTSAEFLRYILTTNSAEIVVMFVAPLFGFPGTAPADPDLVDQPGDRWIAWSRAGPRARRKGRDGRGPRDGRPSPSSLEAWASTSSSSGFALRVVDGGPRARLACFPRTTPHPYDGVYRFGVGADGARPGDPL
jgi:hypothetical protein